MKTKKLAVAIAALGFALSGLIGCAKGGSGSSGSVTGDASISGSTVSSSATVNGQTMSVTISGLSMLNTTYYSGNTGTLNAYVTINGYSGTIQTTAYYNGYYASSSGVNNSNYNSQVSYVGNNYVYSIAQCADSSCTNAALVIWVSPYGATCSYQMKQMGVIENMSSSTIRAAAENVGYSYSCGSSPQLALGSSIIQSMMQSAGL